MTSKPYAALLFQQLLKMHHTAGMEWRSRCEALQLLQNRAFVLATEEERIQFSNLFARISYACQKGEVDHRTQFLLHGFRRFVREKSLESQWPEWEQLYELGLKVTAKIIATLWKTPVPPEVTAVLPKIVSFQLRQTELSDFRQKVRVVALSDDEDAAQLTCLDEARGEEVKVQYNLADRNENFNPTIRLIRQVFGFPVTLNLVDVEVDTAGILRPKAIVVEPDFLIDVTAIADCFQPEGTEPVLYLLKKLLPFESSDNLLIGNIANFFLDELIAHPKATFETLFPKIFRLYPLQFSLLNNESIRDIMNRSKAHFTVIKKMVNGEFQANGIELEECYIEPTFLSETYGIQGRLDAFHVSSGPDSKASIVELKSGKPFMANLYGLSNSHYTQTMLYDLLVKSVYDKTVEPTNYILYSGVPERPLRYAPAVKAQQMEALQVRNQLVGLERQLAAIDASKPENVALLAGLRRELYPKVKGFHSRDLEVFEKTYAELSPLVRKYFNAFAGFIAREHQLAKTGIQGVENVNGMAALWLNSFGEKEENFEIISYLKIAENQAAESEPVIVFQKTERTNQLANFRNGDIAALYPMRNAGDNVLRSQVFKVTIISIQAQTVTIRLRSRQLNQHIFEENEFWNLEHDLLDSSFVGMYRGLFEFARTAATKKALLLTQSAPAEPEPVKVTMPPELTIEQQRVFRKILASRDYFLLWGPPGTGKTSMMLKHLVDYWFSHTQEDLLLLAYTNRAVDEMCEAIESLGGHMRDHYLRIGSRYSTDERFQGQLLDRKIETVNTRAELLEIIGRHRIFVATIASFQTKPELLQLKQFQRVIIDEASQILEPMLVGLLPLFGHFTLIGDHRQLPAVVVQDSKVSAVSDEELKGIGLDNLRNSLFERLFLRCEKEGWTWAYDRLSHQGRMHAEIMQFPNEHFYGGFLSLLPEGFEEQPQQLESHGFERGEVSSELAALLLRRRALLLPTPADDEDGTRKTNRHEAALIVELVKTFRDLFRDSLRPYSMGIITPYRAQIALIRKYLQDAGLSTDELTIDTVERYQGGARDVILISLCTNSDSRIASLTSLSSEGIDRKLNVALTRARRHLVLVGNPDILKESEIYRKLWEWCGATI